MLFRSGAALWAVHPLHNHPPLSASPAFSYFLGLVGVMVDMRITTMGLYLSLVAPQWHRRAPGPSPQYAPLHPPVPWRAQAWVCHILHRIFVRLEPQHYIQGIASGRAVIIRIKGIFSRENLKEHQNDPLTTLLTKFIYDGLISISGIHHPPRVQRILPTHRPRAFG